ncbi:lactate utilization protein [Clostridium akagii]|uniref:lactate utilization protein n=1 Tax=Clostridium akagii TaxID=91623 RepID=UPI00047E7D12|nr:lactate utilization protein [Clostridium akagii]
MDENIKWLKDKKLERTMENLEKHNMEAYYVQDENELIKKISEFTKEGETVAVGGSMTLFETGVIDYLKNGNFNFLDRYKDDISGEELKEVYRKSFFADSYFASSNAITENGELYNVDGTGNRVAAMIYGPDKVIVVVSTDKIVKDLDAAIKRNQEYSAPANAKRLNRKTPCAKVGYCMDCSSEERICNEYTLIKRQPIKGRIKVIFIDKKLGY